MAVLNVSAAAIAQNNKAKRDSVWHNRTYNLGEVVVKGSSVKRINCPALNAVAVDMESWRNAPSSLFIPANGVDYQQG